MVPLGLVKAYARMVRRLTAEESLLEVERVRVAHGALSKDGQRRVLRRWRRDQGEGARPAAARPVVELAAVGIGFQRKTREASTTT